MAFEVKYHQMDGGGDQSARFLSEYGLGHMRRLPYTRTSQRRKNAWISESGLEVSFLYKFGGGGRYEG